MSKESYTRGFCKAAQAAGIDPAKLVKFAQQYKTEGWAPGVVQKLFSQDPNAIPDYFPPRIETNGGAFWTGDAPTGVRQSMAAPVEDESNIRPNGFESPMTLTPQLMKLFPKFRNWRDAHQNALRKVLDISKMINPSRSWQDKYSPEELKVLGKAYHDIMNAQTGTPQRVSAPVKK